MTAGTVAPSLLSRLAAALGYVPAAKAAPVYPASAMTYAPIAGPISWQGWPDQGGTGAGLSVVTPQGGAEDEQRARLAITSSWVYRAVMAIAREVSTGTLVVERMTRDTTGKRQLKAIEEHPFATLWQHPNPFMGRSLMLQFWALNLLLKGEAYLYLAHDGVTVRELWPLPAWWVNPEADDEAFIKAYLYQPDPARPALRIPTELVIYSRIVHPFDVRRGLSPLVAAFLPASSDLAMARWNANFFQDGNGMPTGMAVFPRDMNESDFQRARLELKEFFGGGKRGVAYTRAGDLDWKVLQTSQKEMEFLNGRVATSKEIDTIFGIPEGYWAKDATRANSEGAKATFLENAVWPLLEMLSEDLNAQPIPRWVGRDHYARFEDIRPRNIGLDLQQRQVWSAYRTIDELRKEDGLEPIGDNRGRLLVAQVQPEQAAAGQPGEQLQAAPPIPAKAIPVPDTMPTPAIDPAPDPAIALDLRRWETKALRSIKDGKPAACAFSPDALDAETAALIRHRLAHATDAASVKAAFVVPPPGASLSDEERRLYDALVPVLERAGKDVLQQIIRDGQIDLTALPTELRATLLPILADIVAERAQALAAEVGPDLDPGQAQTMASDLARQYTDERIAQVYSVTQEGAGKVLADWLATPGMTRQQLETMLAAYVGPRRAETIAITEVTRAAAQATAQTQTYLADYGIALQRQWHSSVDDRVCPVCQPLDGKLERAWSGDHPDGPPAHTRCRCFVTLSRKQE